LEADCIDWANRVIAYARKKTDNLAFIHFGEEIETLLRSRPASGPLFPRLRQMHEKHRAKEFKRRCVGCDRRCYPSFLSLRMGRTGRKSATQEPSPRKRSAITPKASIVLVKRAQVRLPSLRNTRQNKPGQNAFR
jgi:hypothetical protein